MRPRDGCMNDASGRPSRIGSRRAGAAGRARCGGGVVRLRRVPAVVLVVLLAAVGLGVRALALLAGQALAQTKRFVVRELDIERLLRTLDTWVRAGCVRSAFLLLASAPF